METLFEEEGPEDLEVNLRDLATVAPERVIRFIQVKILWGGGRGLIIPRWVEWIVAVDVNAS